MKVLLLFFAVAMVACLPREEFQHHIDAVNKAKTTWKAGHNFGEGTSMEYVKGLCGSLSNPAMRAKMDSKNKLLFHFIFRVGNPWTLLISYNHNRVGDGASLDFLQFTF